MTNTLKNSTFKTAIHLPAVVVSVLQIAMSEHLKTLEVYNISTIPKLRLPLSVLFAASFDAQEAEGLFQHLRSSLRKPVPTLLHHSKQSRYVTYCIHYNNSPMYMLHTLQ